MIPHLISVAGDEHVSFLLVDVETDEVREVARVVYTGDVDVHAIARFGIEVVAMLRLSPPMPKVAAPAVISTRQPAPHRRPAPPPKGRADAAEMARRRARLVELVAARPGSAVAAYAYQLGAHESVTRRMLLALLDAGELRREGVGGPGSADPYRYYPARAVTEATG